MRSTFIAQVAPHTFVLDFVSDFLNCFNRQRFTRMENPYPSFLSKLCRAAAELEKNAIVCAFDLQLVASAKLKTISNSLRQNETSGCVDRDLCQHGSQYTIQNGKSVNETLRKPS